MFTSRLTECREQLVEDHEYARWPEAPAFIKAIEAVNLKHSETDRLARGEPTIHWDDPTRVAVVRLTSGEPVGEAFLFSGQYLPAIIRAGVPIETLKARWYGYFRSLYAQYGTKSNEAARVIGKMLALTSNGEGVPTDIYELIIRGRTVAQQHHEAAVVGKAGRRAGPSEPTVEDDL